MFHKNKLGSLIHTSSGKPLGTLSQYQMIDAIVCMHTAATDTVRQEQDTVLPSQAGSLCTVNGKLVYLG